MGKVSKGISIAFSSLCLATVALGSFLTAWAFSDASFSKREAEMVLLTKEISSGQFNNQYTLNSVIGDKALTCTDRYFSAVYSRNFSEGETTNVLCAMNGAVPLKFSASIDGRPLSFSTAVLSGKTYSNQQETLRFETVCINLWKYQNRYQELSFDSTIYDGFVYVPDYIADEIIALSDDLNSYEDLIQSGDGTHVFSLGGDSFDRKLKIANVFHVRGFNLEYSEGVIHQYNDRDIGLQLDQFLSGYVFVGGLKEYCAQERGQPGILTMSKPKAFNVDETLVQMKSCCENYGCQPQASLFHSSKNGVVAYSRAPQINAAYYGAETSANAGILFGGIAAILLHLGVLAFLLAKKMHALMRVSCFIGMGLSLTGLVAAFVIKAIISENFYTLLVFVGPPSLIALTALLCLDIGGFVGATLLRRRHND